MAVTFLWSEPLLPDSIANVVFVKDVNEATCLNHTMCGENFLYYDKDKTPVCPYCQGDIIFPRADW